MRGAVAGFVVALAGGLSGAALAQPAPAVDWSGFYVGGGLGATRTSSSTGMTVATNGDYFSGADPAQIKSMGGGQLSQWRPSGGLQGGYGERFGNVLAGLEASVNTLFFNDERSASEIAQSNAGSRFTIKQSVSANWMATLRPRLGWAEGNLLVFVTGGPAMTRLEMDSTYRESQFSGFSHSRETKTLFGWTLGAGGEYALDRNWSLRGDYLYADFGRIKSTTRVSDSTGGAPGSLNHTADLKAHAVMIGFTYRFKGF